MVDEELNKRHLIELGFIKEYLEEIDFKTTILEKSEKNIPFSTLVSVIGKDYKNLERIVNLNFIPTYKELTENILVLQILSVVFCEFKVENKRSVEKILNTINSQLIVGTYSLNEKNQIIFRYIYIVPISGKISKNEFIDTLMLFSYMQELYNDIIESVAIGDKKLYEALEDLKFENK